MATPVTSMHRQLYKVAGVVVCETGFRHPGSTHFLRAVEIS